MLAEPTIRKCCRCVPLRLCLLIWAWFKIIADVIASLYIFIGFLLNLMTHDHASEWPHTTDIIFAVVLVTLIADLVFTSVLIAGLFRKKYSYLKIFLFYGIGMILAEAIFLIVFLLWFPFTSSSKYQEETELSFLVIVLVGISWIAFDICILIILRSEMIKIRNKEQYDVGRIMNSDLLRSDTRPKELYVEKVYQEDSTKNEESGEKYLKLLECD